MQIARIMIAASGEDYSTSWPDLLRGAGHSVKEVASNDEALGSLDFHPDLILCEGRPSKGLDFIALAKVLKKNDRYKDYKLVPVVGFSLQFYQPHDDSDLFVSSYLQTPASHYRLQSEIDRLTLERT